MEEDAYHLHTDNHGSGKEPAVARTTTPPLSNDPAELKGVLNAMKSRNQYEGGDGRNNNFESHKTSAAETHFIMSHEAETHLNMNKNSHKIKNKPKDIVVIAKAYYISHSLRYPSLLHHGKPEELNQLSSTTWFDIQTQLEPLLTRHLFLPKSFFFVPLICLIASLAWFVTFSVMAAGAAHNNNDDADNHSVQIVALVFWTLLFLALLALVAVAFARWVAKRNQPVDEELREVCLELSRGKTQAEGYRLEYHKTGSNGTLQEKGPLFATRVLRFVPLPVPTKISVPHSLRDEEALLPQMVQQSSFQRKSSSLSSESSEFPTLQSLSATDFAPFPQSDVILENLASLLFILVVVQCVNSLP